MEPISDGELSQDSTESRASSPEIERKKKPKRKMPAIKLSGIKPSEVKEARENVLNKVVPTPKRTATLSEPLKPKKVKPGNVAELIPKKDVSKPAPSTASSSQAAYPVGFQPATDKTPNLDEIINEMTALHAPQKAPDTPLLDECPPAVASPSYQPLIGLDTLPSTFLAPAREASNALNFSPIHQGSRTLVSSSQSVISSSASGSSQSQHPVQQEINKARGDLRHHMRSLETAHSTGSDRLLHRLDARLRSLPYLRLQLSGVVDQFFHVLAPLHQHPDGELEFSNSCQKCREMESLLFQAIDVTDHRLCQIAYRDSTSFPR